MSDGKLLDGLADSIAGVGLQVAMSDVEDFIKFSRNMKSHTSGFDSISQVLLLHIIVRQPTLVSKGELQLISVIILFFGRKNFGRLWGRKMSEVFKIVGNLFLFKEELLFVAKHLPLTPAAQSKMAARRFYAQRRGFY